MESALLQVVDSLIEILTSQPFAPDRAGATGAELVRLNLTGPKALDDTIRLLGDALPDTAGLPFDRESQQRIMAITGALSAGYMTSLKDRLFDEQEMIKRAVFRARDIAEQARRASEARWQAVFQSTAAGIAITDLDGTVQLVNPALCEILGRPEESLLGKPFAMRLSPAYSTQVLAAFSEVARGHNDKFVGDVSFLGLDSEEIWTRLSLALVRDVAEEPEYAVAVVENITDLHLLRERQLRMTLEDQLTGLPNRTAFMSQLDTALQHAAPDEKIALCYVDLDGFKIINDGVDHTTGDRVLKRVATTLQNAFADESAVVARIGGDGFGVLVTGSSGTFGISERIAGALDELAEPIYEDEDTGVAVSASVGIVERPAAGMTSADFVRAAEITVHRAKQNGKAQWELFDPALDREYRAKFRLGAAIPGALESGEFQVSYLPVHDLTDNSIIAFRALMNWHHPSRGVLPPVEFLDMAEETGFIVPLGRWLLQTSCEQLAQWQDKYGDDAPLLAIHLTARMARDQDLVQIIRDLLARTRAPADKLRLSMPAYAAVDDCGEPLENLSTLRDINVSAVVHGFGAGGSSLIDMSKLPIEGIVISPAVIRRLGEAPEGQSPFGAGLLRLVAMTNKRGIRLVADGVDTAAVADRLRTAGVRYASGAAIGAAMSDTEVTRLLGGK